MIRRRSRLDGFRRPDFSRQAHITTWEYLGRKGVRMVALVRDDFRCMYEGCTAVGPKNLSVARIMPRLEGGQYRSTNVITVCPYHLDILHYNQQVRHDGRMRWDDET